MSNLQNKKPSSTGKKALRIFLIILLAPFAILILYVAYYFISDAILDGIERPRFEAFNVKMEKLKADIQAIASEDENWDFEKECLDKTEAGFRTGEYYCHVDYFLKKVTTTPQTEQDLHDKYFKIFEESGYFTHKNEAKIKSPDTFGKVFEVSGYYQTYIEKENEIQCSYNAELLQDSDYAVSENLNGHAIEGDTARAIIDFYCYTDSRGIWF